MNAAHAHLMLNNVPGLGILGGLLLLALGALWKSDAVNRAGLVAFVLAGLITVPTFLTGRGAVLVAGQITGVSLPHIGDHEASAPLALGAGLLLAALAAGGFLYRGGRPLPRWYVAVTAIAALFAFSIVMRTSYLGGHIHHPETLWGHPDASQGR